MKKRMMTILLSAVMILSLGSTAFAETDDTGDSSKTAYVAQIGEAQYETLAAAVAAASKGSTITLTSDTSGSGIKIDSAELDGLTIDFAGHTYTVDGSTVGSTGTETQCFQILTGGSVTMKEGTIIADTTSAKMMIQNYSNLTLENMKLDATQGSNSINYVLSNNCGNVTISNSTITAQSTGVAFDVYGGFGSYGNVTVTVKDNSTITGKVEVDRDTGNNNENTLIIEGKSTVNGDVSVVSGTSVTVEDAEVSGTVSVSDGSGASVLVMNSKVGTAVTGNATVYNTTVNETTVNQAATGVVALVGGKTYTGISEAIAAAEGNDVVTLLANVSDVIISDGTNVTIDLNGYTISSSQSHAITNNGTLTVADSSSDKSGKVDGGSTSGKGALYNAGKATLDGGTFTTDSWYVIKNVGDLTINGATVTSNDQNSSAIANGYYSSSEVGYGEVATLTINSGAVAGNGLYTLKNDDYGEMTINGGTFTNSRDNSGVVLNAGQTLTIAGGTFEYNGANGSVIQEYRCSETVNAAVLNIAGGEFKATQDNTTVLGSSFNTTQGGTVTITGGTFTGNLEQNPKNETISVSGGTFSVEVPKIYCAENYSPVANSDGTYSVHVHKAVKTEAKAATCTEAGNTAYWYCPDCGKYFSDEALTKEITKDATVVAATGHNHVTKVDAKAATSTAAGNITYWYCSDCGKYFSDEALTKEIAKDATVIAATGSTSTDTTSTDTTSTGTISTSTTTTPQTGDDSNIGLWIVLLAVSCGGLTTLFLLSRKRSYTGRQTK